ncbi:MAG: ankyrin repeat domain-containing protein [Gammaproteobacteria bacterium]
MFRKHINNHKNEDLLLFLKAIHNEDYGLIKSLITENKIDINAQNGMGQTALYKAVLRNNLQLIELLLELGALTEIGPLGNTPLNAAVQQGNWPVIQLLFKYHADKNKLNGSNSTILHSAVIEVKLSDGALKPNWDLITWLIEQGIDYNYKDKFGRKVKDILCSVDTGYGKVLDKIIENHLKGTKSPIKMEGIFYATEDLPSQTSEPPKKKLK